MKIIKVTSQEQRDKCFDFFQKMWKELFSLDWSDIIEQKKREFTSSEISYIKTDDQIVSVIQYFECKQWRKLTNWYEPKTDHYILWRIWTLESYRGRWYWTQLIKNWLEEINPNWTKQIYIPSELWNLEYYRKFWFTEFWNKVDKWNTQYMYMKNK